MQMHEGKLQANTQNMQCQNKVLIVIDRFIILVKKLRYNLIHSCLLLSVKVFENFEFIW